jgi:hypothetical protein
MSVGEAPLGTQDGFGNRSVLTDPRLGLIERLELAPALSGPASEQAIRARAAFLTNVTDSPLGRVLRIERKENSLAVVSAVPEGVPLSDLLAALEFKNSTLSGEELLELAGSVVAAVARMHERLPFAHGALTPAHIVLHSNGSTILTGAVYGDAVQALQRNRENLWKEFGLAFPSAASLPRFDQRGDVAQLGAVVLAITRRRALRRDEYPRGTNELVMSSAVSADPMIDSKLRAWLQDALQLHGRVVFSSAVDAEHAFSAILPAAEERSLEALSLQTAIRQLCGESETPQLSTESLSTPSRSHLRAS